MNTRGKYVVVPSYLIHIFMLSVPPVKQQITASKNRKQLLLYLILSVSGIWGSVS